MAPQTPAAENLTNSDHYYVELIGAMPLTAQLNAVFLYL